MKTLAVMSQKGGAGKTTLAVHLAVLASQSGLSVALLDTDPQRTASKWWQSRSAGDLSLASIDAQAVAQTLAEAEEAGVALAVIDTAPHAAAASVTVAKLADFILIPCRPSRFDLDAVESTVEIVRLAKRPAAFVLNGCPPRGSIVEEARAALLDHGIPVLTTPVVRRSALEYAVIDGRAVTEYEPEGKASDEIRATWMYLKEAMK